MNTAAARRVAPLPGGGRLIVRPPEPEDLDGLAALFDGLSPDDRYRRFFSLYRPDRAFLLDIVQLARDRGAALVATVDGEIVAEADFRVQAARPDPELSITVAESWRGWLGPYLLDALLELAAELGHTNLEAEVLLSNTKMLALLRSRGYGIVDHQGDGTIHVVVGTSGPMPRWSGNHDRLRVLVEVPGGRWRWVEETRAAGFDVLSCPGPRPGHEQSCPLLRGRACPLAEGADAIITALPADADTTARILAGHQALHHVPVCVPESHEVVEAFLESVGSRPVGETP